MKLKRKLRKQKEKKEITSKMTDYVKFTQDENERAEIILPYQVLQTKIL